MVMLPVVAVMLGDDACTATLTTAGAALTVTPVLAVAVPPPPVAVMVYVVVLFGLTTVEPWVGTEPTPGAIASWVALRELQVSVAEFPAVIVAGLAESVTVGAGGGGGPVELPPPPQDTAPRTPRTSRSPKAILYTGKTAALAARWRNSSRSQRMAYNANTSTKYPNGNDLGKICLGTASAGLAFTAMVRVLLSVPFAGKVPPGGLNAHERPAGRPGQLKVN